MNEYHIEGPLHVVVRDQSVYIVHPAHTPLALYIWTVEKGEIISGQGTSQIEILWQEHGHGKVTVEIVPPGTPPKTTHVIVVIDPVTEKST